MLKIMGTSIVATSRPMSQYCTLVAGSPCRYGRFNFSPWLLPAELNLKSPGDIILRIPRRAPCAQSCSTAGVRVEHGLYRPHCFSINSNQQRKKKLLGLDHIKNIKRRYPGWGISSSRGTLGKRFLRPPLHPLPTNTLFSMYPPCGREGKATKIATDGGSRKEKTFSSLS